MVSAHVMLEDVTIAPQSVISEGGFIVIHHSNSRCHHFYWMIWMIVALIISDEIGINKGIAAAAIILTNV